MPGDNYYLLSSLPTLGELGSPAPLSLADLRRHVGGRAGPAAIVDTVLLSDDLLQRQSYLAGEVRQVSPAVLTAGQVRDEEPLPAYLAPAEGPQPLVAEDAVWAAYYRLSAATAVAQGSEFLADWTGYEVALRNALAAERAKALGLEAQPYLVVPELGRTEARLELLLSEWASAADPLSALRVLDRARWGWLNEHDHWFSFGDDEMGAYSARLMLLHRWQRLTQAMKAPSQRQEGS